MHKTAIVSIGLSISGWLLVGSVGCATVQAPPLDKIEDPLAGTSSSPTANAEPSTEGVRALPKEPDREQTRLAINRGVRTARECSKTHPEGPFGQAKVSLTLSSKGKVASVQLPPPFADTPMAKCIEQSFAHEVIPPWEGPDDKVDAAFSLKKQN